MDDVKLGENLVRPPARFERPPYSHRDAYLAPIRHDADGQPVRLEMRPWEGIGDPKPWEYRTVAGIVHVDQFEMLECVVESLRLQTARPYIHVVDVGSHARTVALLDDLERHSDDIRVDHLHPRGYSHASQIVAQAMDLVFAAIDHGVEFCYATHVDVFLKSRKYLAYLAKHCTALTPVVGYQMSPRKGTDDWRFTPSHTASLYHMPTMRALGATWNMAWAAERLAMSPERFRGWTGWPDTETALGLRMRDAGIPMRTLGADGRDNPRRLGDGPSWLCLGGEPNEPYDTPWFRHERSFTTQELYSRDHADKRRDAVHRSVVEAWDRIGRWKAGEMF
jgi:hypothetical protein